MVSRTVPIDSGTIVMYSLHQPFAIRCNGGSAGNFCAGSDRLSVTVSQQIVTKGKEEMWDFVAVHSSQQPDGTLNTRVLLCHPDWDEPLEIVNIASRPGKGIGAEVTGVVSRPNGKA